MSPSVAAPRRSAASQRALKLFVVLQRAINSVRQRLQEKADLHGLTETEFGILEAVFHKGPLLLGDVQRKILLSSGGVTYTIDRLVEKGLIARQECATDRRARYAVLTEKGRALIEEIFPEHARLIEQLMSGLSAREQDEAILLLRKLGLAAEGDE